MARIFVQYFFGFTMEQEKIHINKDQPLIVVDSKLN